ncbi:MAG: hypothetical protein JW937_00310, partial [Candidatus Omnitrophica bacterium]|nr:hypothetical protein [Candidatus Omnitrophota bacterium]
QCVAEPASITVGDEIAVRVLISAPSDYRMGPPSFREDPSADFEVKRLSSLPSDSLDDERGRWVGELVITSFKTGVQTLPPVEVKYTTPTGQSGFAVGPELQIEVRSVLAAQEGAQFPEFAPLKGPAVLRASLAWWVWALLLLLVAALGAGFSWWKKHGGGLVMSEPSLPPRPADEVALEALDALAREGLLEEGRYRLYFTRLSEILRRFLEGRLGFPAPDWTTAEICRELKKHPLQSEVLGLVRKVLGDADLVKFAKHMPERSWGTERMNQARRVVELCPCPREESETFSTGVGNKGGGS